MPLPKRRPFDEPDGCAVSDWQTRLRGALFDAVKESDVTEIVKTLVKNAKAGDLQATRLLFTYAFGSPNVHADSVVVVNNAASDERAAKLEEMAVRAARGKEVFKIG